MRAALAASCLVFLRCACPPTNTDGGQGGGTGGGGAGADAFGVTVLDPAATDPTYFAIAVDAAQERIGVAYFTPRGTETNAGVPDFDLKYLEWRQGVVSAVSTIRFVQRKVGLSVAFQASGEPAVAFLGGDAAFVPGSSFFWFQNDAVVATRSAGAWTQTVVARTGDQAQCGNIVSDRGLLVGLWPSIVFDPAGTMYFAWRDGHDGQTSIQDWNGAASKGTDVYFQQRSAAGDWSAAGLVASSPDTMTGASLAWDAQEGWGLAVADGSANQLEYRHSADGVSWSSPDQVFGSASGGWWPSVAMDPVVHEPAIAFYVCSPRANVNASSCVESEDELRVAQRGGGNWHETVVDREGGWAPRVGFFASGKRFVVYRHPKSGVLKLAVER